MMGDGSDNTRGEQIVFVMLLGVVFGAVLGTTALQDVTQGVVAGVVAGTVVALAFPTWTAKLFKLVSERFTG